MRHSNTDKRRPAARKEAWLGQTALVRQVEKVAFPVCTAAAVTSSGFSGGYFGGTAGSDGFSIIDAVATVAVTGMLGAGATSLFYIGCKILPRLPRQRKGIAFAGWLMSTVAFSTVSGSTSTLFVAEPAAQAAHQEHEITRIEDEADRVATIKRQENDLVAQFDSAASTSANFASNERAFGPLSQMGPGKGPVALELEGLANLSKSVHEMLLQSRAQTQPMIRRMEELRRRIRNVQQNGEFTEPERASTLRQYALELQQTVVDVHRTIPLSVLRSAIDAYARDWTAMGLPEAAAAKLGAFYAPLAQRVSDAVYRLEDATAMPVRPFSEPEGFDVIGQEFEAVFPLIITCALLEITPISVVLLLLLISARPRRDDDEDRGPSATAPAS